jgi:DNA-directed RNA polymerase subunit alpha
LAQQELLELPEIEVKEDRASYARVEVAPLMPGFGITLGNALRRVLLSSLPGAAVTRVRIEGLLHEFSTIRHVKEDAIEFLLNVKQLRIRALAPRPGTIILDVGGREGEVTAAELRLPEHLEIVNPEQQLLTLDSPEAHVYAEMTVEIGRGFRPASQQNGLPIGVIAVDAVFSPVRKVSYQVEPMRVGQAANYDRLILEVWTDGTIEAVEAIRKAADILIDHLRIVSRLGRFSAPMVSRGIGAGLLLTDEQRNMPISELRLSMRTYNALRRTGIETVGQLLERTEEEILSLRNFGPKSYEELRQRLEELGILPARGKVSYAPSEGAPEVAEEMPLETMAEEEAEEALPATAAEEAVAAQRAEEATVASSQEVEAGAPAEAAAQVSQEEQEVDPRLAKLQELKAKLEREE